MDLRGAPRISGKDRTVTPVLQPSPGAVHRRGAATSFAERISILDCRQLPHVVYGCVQERASQFFGLVWQFPGSREVGRFLAFCGEPK